jgi:putative transposase
MKRKRFTEEQIIGILKEGEAGKKAEEISREYGISVWTFYQWRKKYGGMEVTDAKRLKALEEENRKLKRVVADLTLDNVALKDILSKKW